MTAAHPPRVPPEVAALFTCLADASRRDILGLVADRGRVTATMIAEVVPVTRQGVAKHLAVLEEAGLVTSTRVGREVLHAVQPEPLQAAARWLDATADAWGHRLDSLKAAAEGRD